ncbi:MAG TPA: glycosyl hydrolase family 43 [bacterium]|nr:glycosyl hydrolase family 43 [bacterium]
MEISFPDWKPEKWVDFPQNPLIEPPNGYVIGDPYIILPGEYDNYWHLFASGKGIIYRFISEDGIKWRIEKIIESFGDWVGFVYLHKENGKWYIFYAKADKNSSMVICGRESEDLENWSDENVILKPELEWEMEGKRIQVRNPCLIKTGNIYRLYYSAGTIWLDDCGYEEPKYISFAESENIFGPYRKYGEPIIKPDGNVFYRNFGAGALKVFILEGKFIGLNNGLYRDENGRSRSAISLMVSEDGIKWIDFPFNPIISPKDGWKKALVYQLDMVDYNGRKIIYYNARDGWREGKERIGACELLPSGGDV